MYPVRLLWRPALLRPTLRALRVGTCTRTETERHTTFCSASWFSVASNAGPPCQRITSFSRTHRADTTSVRASRRKQSYSFLSILYRFETCSSAYLVTGTIRVSPKLLGSFFILCACDCAFSLSLFQLQEVLQDGSQPPDDCSRPSAVR